MAPKNKTAVLSKEKPKSLKRRNEQIDESEDEGFGNVSIDMGSSDEEQDEEEEEEEEGTEAFPEISLSDDEEDEDFEADSEELEDEEEEEEEEDDEEDQLMNDAELDEELERDLEREEQEDEEEKGEFEIPEPYRQRYAEEKLPEIEGNYDSDSSTEETENTIGNVPLEWYSDLPHIGYDVDGKKILKPATSDELDKFLATMEDPDSWKTVK
ncbi:Ribosome bioproteinsis protein erb1, partial [Rhizopus stolonifer]